MNARLIKQGVALGLMSLSGCMVGPHYRPPVQAPVATRATPATVSAAPTDLTWWKQFQDPTLDGLLSQALGSNLDLAIAVARVQQARALFREDRLDLLPHVTSNGGYTRGNEQILGVTKDRVPIESADVGFDASWEIDLFGRIRHQVNAAKAEASATQEDLAAVRISVAAEVVRYYLLLRGAQQLDAVVRENAAAAEETLRLMQVRADNGGANPVDLESAKVQLQSELAKLPELHTQELQASARLAVLCGERAGSLDDQLLAKAARLQLRETPLPVGDLGDLLQRRPDVRAAERRLAAETEKTGAATADLFPRINVTGFLGFLSGNVSSLFGSSGKAWSVSPSVSWPAFDLGSVQARLRGQRARQTEAAAQYQKTALLAIEELQNALTTYRDRREQLAVLAAQVSAANRASDLAGIQYKEGSIDYLRRLDAQRVKLSSEEELTRVATAANADVVAIYKALGGVGS